MAAKKDAPGYLGAELIRATSGVERDVLSVVLERNKTYTRDEAKKLWDEFMRKGGEPDVRGQLGNAE